MSVETGKRVLIDNHSSTFNRAKMDFSILSFLLWIILIGNPILLYLVRITDLVL